jgi:hypothetical protein
VPKATLDKVGTFLETACDYSSEGYVYYPSPRGAGSGAPTTTAIALLCRQYLQGWDAENERLVKGVKTYLKPNGPGSVKSMYYYFYATQLMHHVGGTE